MVTVIELDVSTLEPPQPMREICEKLEQLELGKVLHVTHRRKPVPLFEMLESKYKYFHQELQADDHHMWFWLSADKDAEQFVRDIK
ncbi:DUF2249 domain-containing protein [Vibrio sp. HN007]|uniref:DUF2249 domain-containing protein n=1 Tax=Vibrio iocasae TaxID=3098914 RepID=UPI0035D43044